MTRCAVCPTPCADDCACRCHPSRRVLCATHGCLTWVSVRRNGPFPAYCEECEAREGRPGPCPWCGASMKSGCVCDPDTGLPLPSFEEAR